MFKIIQNCSIIVDFCRFMSIIFDMDELQSYLNINITYRDYYIEHNDDLESEELTAEKFYISVSEDLDIVLNNLNILPSKTGYLFWKDAVFLYLFSSKAKISICKDIYPAIAKKHETTTMCVDRAMRRCFENVLYYASKNEHNYICLYLKNALLFPRNSEIIVKLVELISSKKFQENKLKLAI
ncbi:MAG: hypothetical protein E7341_02400 [Clostridiales bacterium]|nr:hypothetical protein [Clostridiales bacterium]